MMKRRAQRALLVITVKEQTKLLEEREASLIIRLKKLNNWQELKVGYLDFLCTTGWVDLLNHVLGALFNHVLSAFPRKKAMEKAVVVSRGGRLKNEVPRLSNFRNCFGLCVF
ncbi:hypothetical protein HA466_0015200 [Hirschfeldia incana]|nr:hypothetical protein HA466_0015200 [Hirschfeldia incana]